MSSTEICEGCGTGIPVTRFIRHLRGSNKYECAVEAARLGEVNRYYPHLSLPRPPSPGSPMAVDPAGDFFGEYDQLDNELDIEAPGGRSSPTQQPRSDDEVASQSDDDRRSDLSDDDDDEFAEAAVEREVGWEPPRSPPQQSPPPDNDQPPQEEAERIRLPRPIPPHRRPTEAMKKPKIVHFPQPLAGSPISLTPRTSDQTYRDRLGGWENIWYPFSSKLEWQLAKWAKTRGPSSTAVTELLDIPGLVDALGLSFKTANELNHIIDVKLPTDRPRFQMQEVVVQGEAFELYFRDIIACVRALLGDSEFTPYLKFAPEKHYSDEAHTKQLYHDMHTGRWWWATQETVDREIGPGGTIIPIILSSDKTQVTVFRNKSAYPIYLSIGNIPKEVRRRPSSRAYVLLGYIPTTRLEHITNKASRRRCLANLFHACMRIITAPLTTAGEEGIIAATGDGVERRGHPILAIYVGDYPEQVLVTCCTTGLCPLCQVPRHEVGNDTGQHPLRDLGKMLDALALADESPSAFIDACSGAGMKPVFDPFWASLPFCNIFVAITPDLLHQLYQGVFKHLKAWALTAFTAAEIDARCRRLPPNHNIRLFMKGISSLSHLTGQEHDQIARFFLGLIVDAPLPNGVSSDRLVRCIRALIDFLFIARFPLHSDDTLAFLEDALQTFHDNKSIFVDLGIRDQFHIPKLHFLNHYIAQIRRFGSLDNCNTENTERLHIDLAKEAYRATNKKDEYPQMTQWLERKEKVMRHENYVQWRLQGSHSPLRVDWIPPSFNDIRTMKLTKHPSSKQVRIVELIDRYGVPFFRPALDRFILQLRNPTLTGRALETAITEYSAPVSRILPFHRMKFVHTDFFSGVVSTADSIHAIPERTTKHGKIIPGRFDTALIDVLDPGSEAPPKRRFRIGQVRLIFSLPSTQRGEAFSGIPEDRRPTHMAYIEWFTSFDAEPDGVHGLYRVSRCDIAGGTLASIVDVRRLERSAHLLPVFGPVAPREWTSSNVLEQCKHFYFNVHSDSHMYKFFTPRLQIR